MKHLLFSLACCSFLALPLNGFAAEHDHSQHMMPSGGGHDATQMMHNDSIMLGEQTVDNVKAMAHLNDVGAVMAKMGKKENYHFMVMFSDAKTGAAIDQGTVAVKITDPTTGQAGAAIALMGMGGHFGADVALMAKGEYQFTVGTKLADGGKRQYSFRYTVK
jgi:hypothetical protein